MEGKYGRLFTERDLQMVLVIGGVIPDFKRADEHVAKVLATFDRHEGTTNGPTFPADEPLFLLRGQDQCAPDAIADGPLCYEDECQLAGASDAHREAVRKAAGEMRDWQRANPDRVKVPD